jgi:hypothetical protein
VTFAWYDANTGEKVCGAFVHDQRKSGLFGAKVIINLGILP